MKKLFLIIVAMMMPTLAVANDYDGVAKYFEAIEKGDVPTEQIGIIYAILSQTNELAIHQQNGAKNNRVYLHKNGHQEVVFDENNEPVQDGINDGSYNYYHPYEQPLMHFAADTSPWIMFGQSLKDTTTVKSRIYAYMGDLENGIVRSLKQKKIAKVKITNDMQKEALAIFLNSIEKGNAEQLFELFKSENDITDKQLVDILTKLNKGFNITYHVE